MRFSRRIHRHECYCHAMSYRYTESPPPIHKKMPESNPLESSRLLIICGLAVASHGRMERVLCTGLWYEGNQWYSGPGLIEEFSVLALRQKFTNAERSVWTSKGHSEGDSRPSIWNLASWKHENWPYHKPDPNNERIEQPVQPSALSHCPETNPNPGGEKTSKAQMSGVRGDFGSSFQ